MIIILTPAPRIDFGGAHLERTAGSCGGGSGNRLESASAGFEEEQPGSSPQMPQHRGNSAQHTELCPGAAEQAGVFRGT